MFLLVEWSQPLERGSGGSKNHQIMAPSQGRAEVSLLLTKNTSVPSVLPCTVSRLNGSRGEHVETLGSILGSRFIGFIITIFEIAA